MKSGTTSLWRYLQMHPDIYFGIKKETNFFAIDENYRKGLAWYHAHYPDQAQQILGDASVAYTRFPRFSHDAAERIHDYNPRMKMIYVLRNPVIRSLSHYFHNHLNYKTLPNVEILDEDFLQRETQKKIESSYWTTSDYKTQTQKYLKVFPSNQLLFVDSSRLKMDSPSALREITQFLNLDPLGQISDFQQHHLTTLDQVERKWLTHPRSSEVIGRFLKDGYLLNPQQTKELILSFDEIIQFSEKQFGYLLPDWRSVNVTMEWQRRMAKSLAAMKFKIK